MSGMDRPPIAALQLATLVATAPDGDAWIHERKYDGYRILADKTGRSVTLYSRRFHDWTAQLPAVAAAIAALPARRLVLDGEVAIVMPDGRTSFQALQGAFGGGGPRPTYFAFDLLAEDGADLTALPLEERKRRLAALCARASRAAGEVVRYSDHVIGGGPAFFRAACEIGLEGIVSKRRDAPYLPGRGTAWVKTKCLLRQELVIGGFTEPSGNRTGIGALLVGHYQGGALVYAGKVGTGFTANALAELEALLAARVVAESPFTPAPVRSWTGPRRHWVRPDLVAEIAFTEWTADGRLRHPSFKGLRADKPAAEVSRERAVSHPQGTPSPQGTARSRSSRAGDGKRLSRSRDRDRSRARRDRSAGPSRPRPRVPRAAPPRRPARRSGG
jgi:bifunctional non-homologous end joining protein LigD